jgi:hypothetical protein
LIIYDSEDAEIIIVERVAKVRVITEKVAQQGDFEERHGEVIESELVPAAKRRRCKVYGEPGHRKDTCPQENKDDE